ncbi:MAG TPA: malto-oligosyltrehalose synthase [Solirubrobacteraceae bacterium]|nr:malto-oligosyltrehalose synthase [Solirubrobacteraceae bacterium]
MAAFRATYRLQLGGGFGFAQARELVPYLRDLGISHLYLPPSFQAREGSTHGYDVVDPGRFSEELGGEREFDALAAAARRAGLGLILDVVPNHMAADDANRYWADPALRTRFFDVDDETGRHRRFFDIDHLAAVRQEDEHVFEETHRLALRLVGEGVVDGLRVDHPDGLADPAGYLRRLRDGGARHVWVEKILDPGEPLRDWPVEGTVGYEFLNDVAGLFVDPSGEAALTDLWAEISGDPRAFGEVALEAKLEQVEGPFAPEVDRLRREAPRHVGGLERTLASLPVYRTYVEPWSGRVEEPDREAIAEAGLPPSLERVLTLAERGWDAFVTRFQQTTPAIMAKGVEDTAFYRYGRLLALNDVGGDPSRFGLSVDAFHAGNQERARRFPHNLLVTQTHDTKRSGDVRARIGALAGIPEEWAAHVRRWLEACSAIEGPDQLERYFLFQTLVGAWPIEAERVEAYVEKALREAKRTTNWIEPDTAHEERVKAFCRALYDHRPFLADFEPFAAEVARLGERAALGQLLLKLTVPGVPDIYQGDELLALSLVDPDNRRPVDWARRRELLDEVRRGAPPTDETRKLWLIVRALTLRAHRPGVFEGSYTALEAGPDAVAFLREDAVLVAVRLRGGGGSVDVPAGTWRDVLAGGERRLAGPTPLDELVDGYGLALLERVT